MEWNLNNSKSCYTNYKITNINTNNKYISFDFDNTLVDYKTKHILPNVVETFSKLHTQYNIIIFSNQLGVSKHKVTNKDIQNTFNNFIQLVNIPIIIFYSIQNDKYRKPNIGMYSYLCELVGSNINMIYFCGDAAGRQTDFSTCDLYFANNCKIPYKTPEEIFHNNTDIIQLACKGIKSLQLYKGDQWIDGKLSNPRSIFKISDIQNVNTILKHNKKILIILVGPPGSGKSTMARKLSMVHNLFILSRDIYKKLSYREHLFNNYMNDNNCNGIIIDDLNNKKKSREFWYNKIKDRTNWSINTIYICIPKLLSFHLCNYRHMFDKNKYIPNVVIHKYYKELEPPENSIVYTNAFTEHEFDETLRYVW